MLTAYPPPDDGADAAAAGGPAPVWIDLYRPTPDETARVCGEFGLRIPDQGQISEIESSSRIFVEGEAIYLSTPMLVRPEHGPPELMSVGFILTPEVLVSIRFAPSIPMEQVAEALHAHPPAGRPSSIDLFVRIAEATVDRAADILEHLGAELDRVSMDVFRRDEPARGRPRRKTAFLRETLRQLGRAGDKGSQVRDSLHGLSRITAFTAETAAAHIPPDVHVRLRAVRQDITSLSDHEGHLESKVQFLLDAVLGFISVEQNDVVQVLTIVSVVGVPPVLVAGIYGMNFKIIPEYNWAFGYPYALALMVVSAVVPLLVFKWRGWM